MNVFVLDEDIIKSVQYYYDSHVVKIILEAAQCLSTAHRVLDGKEELQLYKNGRRLKRFILENNNDDYYLATHVNHPLNIFIRESKENYNFIYNYFLELNKEFSYRFNKIHLSYKKLNDLLINTPKNINKEKHFNLEYYPRMMGEYVDKNLNVVDNYRKYYKEGKSHLIKYTKREKPEWLL